MTPWCTPKAIGDPADADDPSQHDILLYGDCDEHVMDACAIAEKLNSACLRDAARHALKSRLSAQVGKMVGDATPIRRYMPEAGTRRLQAQENGDR